MLGLRTGPVMLLWARLNSTVGTGQVAGFNCAFAQLLELLMLASMSLAVSLSHYHILALTASVAFSRSLGA